MNVVTRVITTVFYHFVIAVGRAKEAQSAACENERLNRSQFFRPLVLRLASAKDALPKECLLLLHSNRIIEWQYSPFAIFTMDPYRIRATAERLKRLPEGRRRRLLVVRGHLFYGIHEFLPQGATYITMLREPVVRLLSSYYFILRRPLHPMHRKLKKERLGVEDYIRLTPHRQNLQCDSSPESAMVGLAMSAHWTLQKKIFRDHLV